MIDDAPKPSDQRPPTADTTALFSQHSELYSAARPLYPDALFETIAGLCESHELAWDCATGNGQAALGLSKHFARVEASDVSPEQIARAFPAKNVRYSVENAAHTSYPDESFDVINVAQALHWFAGEEFWSEVNRVAKPTARFVAYSYAWSRVNGAVDAVVKEQLIDVIEPFWSPKLQLCWSGYSALALPFPREVSPRCELLNTWSAERYLDYLRSWSGVQSALRDLGDGFWNRFTKALNQAWREPKRPRAVVTPLSFVVGRPRPTRL
jgi:SAM-dependent methyltransferase